MLCSIFKGRYLPMKMEKSVSKRRHIKFRRRGITQKKAYKWANNVSLYSIFSFEEKMNEPD